MPPTNNNPRPDYVYGPAQGDQSGVVLDALVKSLDPVEADSILREIGGVS